MFRGDAEISEEDQWFVELDGEPVAVLSGFRVTSGQRR